MLQNQLSGHSYAAFNSRRLVLFRAKVNRLLAPLSFCNGGAGTKPAGTP